MAECRKHPGTQKVILTTKKGMDYVACPECKKEAAGRVAAPPAAPAKAGKKAAKTPAKKAPAKKTPAVKQSAAQPPAAPARRGLFARFGR